MDHEINLRIVVELPPKGVKFGLQKGNGKDYETIQKQQYTSGNLNFAFTVRVNKENEAPPNFLGSFVQGPKNERFVYIDIGTFAGQTDSVWSRRLKIPLTGISWKMIHPMLTDNGLLLETLVPGTGKGGGPNCGTVKPFNGWYLTQLVK